MPSPNETPSAAHPSIYDLRCESLTDPLGIDSPAPRLTWKISEPPASNDNPDRGRGLVQTGYRVLVASRRELLDSDQGDFWDSGRTMLAECHAVYAGKPLVSEAAVWWKVQVGTQAVDSPEVWTEWSAPSRWSMGLLSPADWGNTHWIGAPDLAPGVGPLLRREFTLPSKPVRATAYVCGLGFYELRLNGAKVGDHELDPGFTRYDRRVLYVTHDITKQLSGGRNTVGAWLGGGWYDYTPKAAWDFDKAAWRDRPKLLCRIVAEFADGTRQIIVSDGEWRVAAGPITANALLTGETFDARHDPHGWDQAGFDASAWKPVQTMAAPAGTLHAQTLPPIRTTEVLPVAAITTPKPGVHVVDFGINIAGTVEMDVSGAEGSTVTLVHGETLHPDGTVDQSKIAKHTHEPGFGTDHYTLCADCAPATWRPRFTYHGFRYAEITGWPGGTPRPDSFRAHVLHTDFPSAGSFGCSNDLLNRIQAATRRSFVGNFHHMPTDCPQREKNGWTGDAALACETGLYNYDLAASYRKWAADLRDSQTDAGILPGIVPTAGWGYAWGNGPAWDAAYLFIPWSVYQFTGDSSLLREHYPNWVRYVDYLATKADNHIVSIGLGDWCPWKAKTPTAITSTAFYYRDLQIVTETAALLGHGDDSRRYAALAADVKKAYQAAFLNPAAPHEGGDTQTALSCALYFDLAPENQKAEILNRLVANVEANDSHLDVGILGAKWLLHALSDNGRADVAHQIATKETKPSWGWWLKLGATSLWEQWDEHTPGDLSLNHIMFGDISAWMYGTLAGLKPDPSGPGFRKFIVRPALVPGLTYAHATHESPNGPIAVDWRREGSAVTLSVAVPPNASATIHVPAVPGTTITEGGHPVAESPGVKLIDRTEETAVFAVGSGRYVFGGKAA